MKVSRKNKVIVFLLAVAILVGVAVGIYFIVNKPTASKENPQQSKLKQFQFQLRIPHTIQMFMFLLITAKKLSHVRAKHSLSMSKRETQSQ